VWEIVEMEKGMRNMGAGWVFTCKDGVWKARWVAKGFTQLQGLKFNKTHAAVAHKDTHTSNATKLTFFRLS
jgi:hypothetical protein